jgi:hypothetical protein
VGLVFGLVHLRSPEFSGVQTDLLTQVADVNGIQRTVIPTPESRKVDRSPMSLVAILLKVSMSLFTLSHRVLREVAQQPLSSAARVFLADSVQDLRGLRPDT